MWIEDEGLDTELDAAALKADEVAAAADCICEALSDGLFGVVVSDGRSLVVACLRSLAGACRSPMLLCTHSPKQTRTRKHRLCIFLARSCCRCGLQALLLMLTRQLHIFARSRQAQV